MDAHTVIEDWESEPFDGGLAALGTRGFDGAVEAAGTWLFLRGGDPIAVLEDLDGGPAGDVDALEGASGRRHAAPDTASATLAAMLALGGEVRGRYFSDDTPLSAVHDTLSDGGFTGYVELSENVLSGDYYYVYVEGAVEHVGFVGSGRHVGGEEAKRTAEDEVGIYAVVAVSLDDLELPAPASGSDPDSESGSESDSDPRSESESPTATLGGDGNSATDAGLGADTDSVSSLGGSDSDTDPDPDADEGSTIGSGRDPGGDSGSISGSLSDSDPDSGSVPDSGDTIASDAASRDGADTESASEPVSEPPADSASPDGASPDGASTDGASAEARSASGGADARDPSTDGAEETSRTADTERDRTANAGPNDTGEGDASPSASPSSARPSASLSDSASPSKRTDDGGDPGGIDGLETRQVPSLDPERSSVGDGADTDTGTDPTADAAARPSPSSGGRGDASDAATPDRSRNASDDRARESDPAGDGRTAEGRSDADPRPEHDERIAEYEARIEDLESRLAEREERIQELNAELRSLRSERDDLEAELEAADASGAVGADAEMTPTDALAETSLFVRERTRGEDTLADAHDGRTDREAVAKNVHIEHHTTFESEAVTVEGEPFEAWLEGSDPYAFVEWLVTELLFGIRSTGAAEGLGPLYDALPAVDRIGFGETLTAGSGTEGREITFDIVLRDRKGNPLVVAHYDQDRDPTYAETIEPFVADCSDVCEANGTLAAAMVVTSSYFEADAMQATEEATSTSLLSRSTHRSYVKLSRSNGYHLCLIEARDGSFNLTVPEL
ncbi:DUF7527 domain-containing protein [Natronomonas sp.]|uniref:DUF7527 domain-containing protein n=1 Tax=Natronomonas sp. TaxID=2184060 RepID=UPI00260F59DC|nr:hypothetical protein [Natronomonas sp.]